MAHIGPNVTLDEPAFIHDTAQIHGNVYLGKGISVWTHAVMRAEMHEIRIGDRTNIQDFVMVHIGNFTPTIVGEDCSITHHATLHGCKIGDRCLIGINSTIMDGAIIGANSVVAGNSIVKQGTEFPENSVIAGAPAKLIATRNNKEANLYNSLFYQLIAKNYATGVDTLSVEDLETLTVARSDISS